MNIDCLRFCCAENTLVVLSKNKESVRINFLMNTVSARSNNHLILKHTVIRTFETPMIKALLGINNEVFGTWLDDNFVTFFQKAKGKWTESKNSAKSTILLSAHNQKIIITYDVKLRVHNLEPSKREVKSVVKILDDSLSIGIYRLKLTLQL